MYSTLLTLTRSAKISTLLACDTLAVLLATALTWALTGVSIGWLILPVGGLAMLLNWALGIPRMLLQSFEPKDINRIGFFVLSLGALFGVAARVLGESSILLAALLIALLTATFSITSRLIGLQVMSRARNAVDGGEKMIIYGAGTAGQHLFRTIGRSTGHKVVAFIDDNPALHKVQVGGVSIYPKRELKRIVEDMHVTHIVLAIPSAPEAQLNEIIRELAELDVEVLRMPSLLDLERGASVSGQLRKVEVTALLERDRIDLDLPQMFNAYQGHTILVSGAGGTIGGELVRQLIAVRPKKLILFERSEYALYQAENALKAIKDAQNVELVFRLGSVCDEPLVRATLEQHKVDVVLHAAAYKHVPIVELNEVEGVRNNVLGTDVLARCARDFGIERFILISTDKAVRPANVMGATKRMAELVVARYQAEAKGTIFSMVRFGNVIGSSGSAVPHFQAQIAAGGPITVTHAEMTRYMMTREEAAKLVLIAGAMAKGGETYVLDVGKPVSILALAKKMIRLAGVSEKTALNPDGDIEIVFTGLRPGEKMHEELVTGDAILPTDHEKIVEVRNAGLSVEDTDRLIAKLREGALAQDPVFLRACLEQSLPDYRPKLHPAASEEAENASQTTEEFYTKQARTA
ncbi:polysaccharide biosynthesis protein [Paracoccaceae bacterium GXU_MW_L88]